MWFLIQLEEEHFSSSGCIGFLCTGENTIPTFKSLIFCKYSNVRCRNWNFWVFQFVLGRWRKSGQWTWIHRKVVILTFLWAVTDSVLHQRTGIKATFGAHRVRTKHVSNTGLLSMTSCQKHWTWQWLILKYCLCQWCLWQGERWHIISRRRIFCCFSDVSFTGKHNSYYFFTE